MSRYVRVELPLRELADVEAAMGRLGVAVQRGVDGVMLSGSLECPGEPVDLRIEGGAFDTVEDFGFVESNDSIRLVCGELDRRHLEERMLPQLQAEVATLLLERAADRAGVHTTVTVEPDGTRRVKLRR
jgi:hypothetical protein